MLPELNALISRKCHNYAGKICIANPDLTGTICHVVVQLPQVNHVKLTFAVDNPNELNLQIQNINNNNNFAE